MDNKSGGVFTGVLCFTLFVSLVCVASSLYAVVVTEKTVGIPYDANLGAGYHFSDTTVDINGVCTGTLNNGATWAAGKIGSGLKLDGIDDYMEVSDHANLDAQTGVSIEFWLQPLSDMSTSVGYVVSKGKAADGASAYYIAASKGRIMAYVNLGATEETHESWGYHDITTLPYTWYHMVFTYDGATGIAKAFINGMENAVHSRTAGNITTNAYTLKVGDSVKCFNGIVDELRIYKNYTLSPAEVLDHYQHPPSEIYDMGVARKSKAEWSPTIGTSFEVRSAADSISLLNAPWVIFSSSGSSLSTNRCIQYRPVFALPGSTISSLKISPQFIDQLSLIPVSPVQSGSLTFDMYFSEAMQPGTKPTVSFNVDNETKTSNAGAAGGGWAAGSWSGNKHYYVTYSNIATAPSGFASVTISGAISNITAEVMETYTDENILLIDGSGLTSSNLSFFPDPFSPNNDGKNETTRLINIPVLTSSVHVIVKIFDLKGKLVKKLYDSQCGPGVVSVPAWDGTDENGRSVPIGVYLFQINMGNNQIKSGTVTLAK